MIYFYIIFRNSYYNTNSFTINLNKKILRRKKKFNLLFYFKIKITKVKLSFLSP